VTSISGAVRTDKTPWEGGIKDVGVVGNDGDKPISERIKGLNMAIRQDKRILRTGSVGGSGWGMRL